ncbi:MAG: hypothetical protein HWD84_11035 [Flavobacteriaceae bacterium]|nr:hypothetical protein [Flavobacteriaceae bacterium]
MERENKYLGFLKYEGELVNDGVMDARKSAQALLGFDEAVRFFVGQQVSELRKYEYEFPVQIKKGSWEIAVPELIQLVKLGSGAVATAYGVKAAQKMAEKDFENFGIKDIFKKSISAIQWFIRIGKHLGSVTIKSFNNVEFAENNQLIGIKNSNGETLYVPKYFFDLYVSSTPSLIENIANLVHEDRELLIGVHEDGGLIEENLTVHHKGIFTQEESETDEVLFPELVHGQYVVLEGELTRGNEMSNTMGLAYQGHILACHPETGSIVKYKPALFLECRVHGYISRLDSKGVLGARRPKIIFSHIEQMEKNEEDQQSLF